MTNMTTPKPVAVVAGAGPGNGAALARRFGQAGYAVALLARHPGASALTPTELPGPRNFECDVGDPASVEQTFAKIQSTMGEIDVLLFNAGSGVFADVESITPDQFEQAWRVNALGALLCSQKVIPAMKSRKSGAIIFIGATASRRGNVKTAAFAPAKAAQRSLAESMARALWPAGIHVAIVILDGVVDLPRTRKMMPDKPDSFFLKPEELADSVFQVTKQKRSVWS